MNNTTTAEYTAGSVGGDPLAVPQQPIVQVDCTGRSGYRWLVNGHPITIPEDRSEQDYLMQCCAEIASQCSSGGVRVAQTMADGTVMALVVYSDGSYWRIMDVDTEARSTTESAPPRRSWKSVTVMIAAAAVVATGGLFAAKAPTGDAFQGLNTVVQSQPAVDSSLNERVIVANPVRQAVIDAAMSQIGEPYSWGGGGPHGQTLGIEHDSDKMGFDCSSLMQYAFYQGADISISRTTRSQVIEAGIIKRKDLVPGDVIYFQTPEKDQVSHVGMWLGDGKIVHAPEEGQDIRVQVIEGDPDWEENLWYARRYIDSV